MGCVHLILNPYLKIFYFAFAERRTSSKYILYALCTYLFRLSYKKDITTFVSFVKRSPFYLELDSTLQIRKMFDRKRRIYEFIVDEILIKVGDESV
jgi:hypothetical protein